MHSSGLDTSGRDGISRFGNAKHTWDGQSIQKTLSQLTLDEKCSLLSGKNMWETACIERLGIQSLKMTDGPAGVRGAKWTDGSHTTYIPCGISLGASFDPALIEKVGAVLGQEALAKQAHIFLAPTMNISRSPFGGRNFENFGEDPLLTGVMATAYIRGVQSQGVGACMKHYVANDMETRRFNMDQTIDERTLREIYLRPFEIALSANPWTAMAAYPKVNGKHLDTNEHIIKDILRQEWGFDGLVMSDWGGLNDTVESIKATTDLEMPGPPIRYGSALAAAVKADLVSEIDHIDPSVRRLLALVRRSTSKDEYATIMGQEGDKKSNENGSANLNGNLNGYYPNSSTTRQTSKINDDEQKLDRPEFRQLAREAATAGIVLLKNKQNLLPLQPKKSRKLAIIGPNAEKTTHGGTGSAIVNPYYITSPLDSISETARAGNSQVQIRHERAILTHLQPPLMGSVLTAPNTGTSGFQVDFYEGHEFQGDIVATTNWQDSLVYLMSDGDKPATLKSEKWCYRCTGKLQPTVSGTYQFSFSSTGKAKLFLNDNLLIDNTNWTQISGNFMNCGSVEVFEDLDLVAGEEYVIRVDNVFAPPPTRPHDNTLFHKISGMRVGLLIREDEEAMYRSAIEAAKESDVAVVVVGHNNDTEREGSDRTSMMLPGRTNDLVADVCAVNPNTIVVVQSACAVAMPWNEQPSSIIQAWYQGQENGNAIADVLFGLANPSGKLPLTFPKRIEDHGSFEWYPDAKTDKATYGEGVLVGYRWFETHNIRPLWPFGFGLSYTSFKVSEVAIGGKVAANGSSSAFVKATVTNTGSVEGSEVIQVYVSASPMLQTRGLQFAVKSLAGFQKVCVRPGHSTGLEIEINSAAVRWFDEETKTESAPSGSWRVDQGVYKCYVGTSSRDIVAELDLLVD